MFSIKIIIKTLKIRFGYDLTDCNSTNLNCVNKSADIIDCDNGYAYDETVFTETAVTKVKILL